MFVSWIIELLEAEMDRVNVLGTERLLEACKSSSVRAFVFCSSASVVFAGKDILDGDEDLPYPYPRTPISFVTIHEDNIWWMLSVAFDEYADSKGRSEKAALDFNGTLNKDGKAIITTAIRY